MIRNFSLNQSELWDREIRRSQIGRWTLRILGIGIFVAAAQGILLYYMQEKLSEALTEKQEITKQYTAITSQLQLVTISEKKALEVLNYRKNADKSFMPTGVYYAIADALLPGMVVREIAISTNTDKDKKDTDLTGDYLLRLNIGYNTADIGYNQFLDNFDAAINRIYNGTISRKGMKITSGAALTVRNIIFTGREITVSLAVDLDGNNKKFKGKGTK